MIDLIPVPALPWSHACWIALLDCGHTRRVEDLVPYDGQPAGCLVCGGWQTVTGHLTLPPRNARGQFSWLPNQVRQ
jgi:hypothetical protein